MAMKVRKAVITAAGWGTRFLPFTKSQPKEMLPLMNKPLIQYCVEEAAACGAELVVIVTAPGKKAIKDYFDRNVELENMLERKGETELAEEIRRLSNMIDIRYVYQEAPRGLGHALLTTRSLVGNEPFIVFLPDDILEQGKLALRKMIDTYESYQGSVVAVKRVTEEAVSQYGIIGQRQLAERLYQVTSLVEKPEPGEAPSNLAIVGRYVLTPEIFEELEHALPGKNREIQLTDALQRLLPRQPIYAYEFEGERYDAGTLLGWLEATLAMALKNPDIGPKLRNYFTMLLQRANYPGQIIAHHQINAAH